MCFITVKFRIFYQNNNCMFFALMSKITRFDTILDILYEEKTSNKGK